MKEKPYKKINLALYGDNYDYIQEIAWQNRMNATQYLNWLILEDRKRTGVEPQKKKEDK